MSTLELQGLQRHGGAERMNAEDKRLALALLLSLLAHSLLMSLALGGWALWLPRFALPWDRRIEAPDLQVVVVPAQPAATEPAVTPVPESTQPPPVEQPVASPPALTRSVSRPQTPPRTEAAIRPEANPEAEVNPTTSAATDVAPALSGCLMVGEPKVCHDRCGG